MSQRDKMALLKSMRLYVLLTQAHCRIPILEAARQVISGGADIVQLREKHAVDRDIVRLGRELRRMTEEANVGFIINDRPDLARLLGADGCHVGQEDVPPWVARKVLEPWQRLGVSSHSLAQARRAAADGADYIGVGPIFPTDTKDYAQGLGLDYLRIAAAEVDVPLIAIGGITRDRAGEIIAAGPRGRTGIAVCSAILGAGDVESATAEFRRAIDAAIEGD